MKYIFVILGIIIGMGIPIQSVANKQIWEKLDSSLLSLVLASGIGFVFILALTLLENIGARFLNLIPLNNGYSLNRFSSIPWWGWSGGILSVLATFISMIGLEKVGAASMIVSLIVGQLICALMIDHFGWLSLEQNPMSAWKIGGLCLLVGGVCLLQKSS